MKTYVSNWIQYYMDFHARGCQSGFDSGLWGDGLAGFCRSVERAMALETNSDDNDLELCNEMLFQMEPFYIQFHL